METSICEICKKSFQYKKSHSIGRFCSLECRNKGFLKERNPNYKGIYKVCKQCGKKFNNYNKKGAFCSSDCWYSSRNIEIKCKNCGTIFLKNKSRGGRFCNINCHKEYVRKSAEIIVICEYCGKEFIRLKGKYKKYCSTKCSSLSKSIATIKRNTGNILSLETKIKISRNAKERGCFNGDKNPNYVDGRAVGGKRDNYRGEDWEEIKKIVLERDNYRCQKCGAIERIAVHHLVPYRLIKKNVIDMLISLCPKHHMRYERGFNLGGRHYVFLGKTCFISRFGEDYQITWKSNENNSAV